MPRATLFGPTARALSAGPLSVLSLDVTRVPTRPFGLQENELCLRLFESEAGLELAFQYEFAALDDVGAEALAEATLGHAGLALADVAGHHLGPVVGAVEEPEAGAAAASAAASTAPA
jgi:hypothetical protein